MVFKSGTCGNHTTSGFFGWTAIVEKYQARCRSAWLSLAKSHVSPPSSLRNRPPLSASIIA